MRLNVLVAAAASLMCLAAPLAQAETLSFTTSLKGADEVPPNDSAGTGHVMATLDTATKVFSYDVSYSGLTGPGSAAHFHGPAAPGVNAPPVIMIANVTSPITGTATLTDAQVADLEAGKWYFNVHTAAHKGGEIRGQLQPVQ